MNRTAWTVIGAIVAVVIAWFLVGVLIELLGFLAKLVLVAAIAVAVFFGLRAIFTRTKSRSS
ncbi:hypothetical protein [Agromyces archimandritae]|uniref:Flagellar biosynthesis protein FlhA n=1 Tax=Agromyces archimandritae TaxID=2781962 RepID=A0A975FL28_9MICO|nr:hypothetical protein [Agromyces archimandritae]QTX03851.1 hypothetical protein G127AT_11040 [Agromyces archimandritae]